MKKVKLLLVLMGLISSIGYAQSPWTLGVGYAALDFGPPADKGMKLENWNHGLYLNATRAVGSSFNISTSMALLEIKNFDEIFPERASTTGSFIIDLGGQYKFANGYILSEDSRFDPYLLAGGGNNWIGGSSYWFINGGLGINYWITEAAAINIQSAYESPFEYDAYFHHRIGFRFRLTEPSDIDGDGIADSKDKCPSEKGTKANNGCPDSDGDGIVDADDKCPQASGLAQFGGCPDTDGDGIIDSDDKCPEVKGLAQFGGCPDTDGDGIGDADDACPNDKGVASTKGCPDADADGIADKDDACPSEAGTQEFNGCPDTDGDGIPDKDDKCPKVKGTKANNGCPAEEVSKEDEKEVEKELEVASKAIQFETGKDVIKNESFEELNVILGILNQYPKSKFRIEGHTDNVGGAVANKTLSQKRANAVKKYFTDKGIDASRLSAVGFGQEKPKTSNNTPEGRATNRRVEIHLNK